MSLRVTHWVTESSRALQPQPVLLTRSEWQGGAAAVVAGRWLRPVAAAAPATAAGVVVVMRVQKTIAWRAELCRPVRV